MGNAEKVKAEITLKKEDIEFGMEPVVRSKHPCKLRTMKTLPNLINESDNDNETLFNSSELRKNSIETASGFSSPNQTEGNPTFEDTSFLEQINIAEHADINLEKEMIEVEITALHRVFIFDWDDTLCGFESLAIQSLKSENLALDDPKFEKIDENSSMILSESLKSGAVYIVTNKEASWVRKSAKKLMPKTYKLLFHSSNETIKVISSRPVINPKDFKNSRSSIRKWKYRVFKDIIKQHLSVIYDAHANNPPKKVNFELLVLGDSSEEIEAGKQIQEQYSEYFDNFILKTIKLKEYPSLSDIIEQQELFLQKLNWIIDTRKSLTIKLERTKAQKGLISKTL